MANENRVSRPLLILLCAYLLLILASALCCMAIDFSYLKLGYGLFLFILFAAESMRILPLLFGFSKKELGFAKLYGRFTLAGHLLEALSIFGLIYLGRYLSLDLSYLVMSSEEEMAAYPNSLFIFVSMFLLAFLFVFLFLGGNSWTEQKPRPLVSLCRNLSFLLLCLLAFIQYLLIAINSTFYSPLSYLFVYAFLFGIGNTAFSLFIAKDRRAVYAYVPVILAVLGFALTGFLI